MTIQTLRNETTGVFVFKTQSETEYIINLDAGTVARIVTDPTKDNVLRKDSEILILEAYKVDVGDTAILYLSGVSDDPMVVMTKRETSPVVEITRVM